MNSNEAASYSKLGKNNRIKLAEAVPLPVPFTLFVEPTNSCNFRCVQCPHGLDNYADLAGPVGNMSEKCFQKLLDDLREWKKKINPERCLLKVIRLYLEGEPLINPAIAEMLKKFKENEIAERIEIVTNASLLTKEISEKLVSYGLDYLVVSIYAINDKKHEEVTNTKVTPEQIRQNVKRLREIRDEKNKKTPFIYAKIIDTYDSEENNSFIRSYEGIADETCIEKPMNWNTIEEVNFIDKMYSEEKAMSAKAEMEKRKRREVCPFPFHTMSIKGNGDVLVCCVDWLRKTKIGNIQEKSLEDIWNDEPLYQLRKLHIEGNRCENESCNECEIFYKFSEEDNLDELTLDKIAKREKEY